MMKPIPELHTLLLPAFLTFSKSKKMNGSAYSSQSSYLLSKLESKKLKEYKKYFGLKEQVPLSYFYLISQGAQTALMVDKSFPLPIPGMIHLESKMKQLADIDIECETLIKSDVFIENKDDGSLLPVFTEKYFQNDIQVVEVRSTYLVKRKSKRKNKEKRENQIIENKDSNWLSFNWVLKRRVSLEYAKISGDYNPIHIASIFAWFFGFKRKIIHGWYLCSRTAAEIEKETAMPAKSIEIQFLKALTLPNKPKFEFRLGHDRNLEFRISDSKSSLYYSSGIIE